MNGIIIVNKPALLTSRDVVNRVCDYLKIRKIGHTGTLDPIATGVLVLCVGKATKLVDMITSEEKEYIASAILGIKTDTEDITGVVQEQQSVSITKQEIEQVLKDMIGNYEQMVPLYSAVKVRGKKLYDYARNNEQVSRPVRLVEIKELELLTFEENCFTFRAVVSKGTYIRTLITDIATRLGTIGVMSGLKRTRQGRFSIDDSTTLEQLELGNYQLLPMLTVFEDDVMIEADEELANKLRHGQKIIHKYPSDRVVFVSNKQHLIGIYQVDPNDQQLLKPWKMVFEQKECE